MFPTDDGGAAFVMERRRGVNAVARRIREELEHLLARIQLIGEAFPFHGRAPEPEWVDPRLRGIP
jgi:hypothetical protein